MKAMKKIIIKVGTSTLQQGTQKLSRRYMLGLVQQIIHLHNQGLQIILVSSGAVATGKELLKSNSCSDTTLPPKQACASIGQIKLMQVWAELFALFDLQVGQILLTKDHFSKRNRCHTRDTIHSLMEHRIIPIINENDAVTTKENRVGDNDNLAALVAHLIEADTVILLTDQEGLYTADPRFHSDAKLISHVEKINQEIFALAGSSGTACGTGGMITKLQAAQFAARSGVQTIIASSTRSNVLIDLLEGKRIGTLFLEEGSGYKEKKKPLKQTTISCANMSQFQLEEIAK